MREHPIDRLFAQRLKDLEKMPSDDVWARLQERKTDMTMRRHSQWRRFVAAAVVAGLLLCLQIDRPNTHSGKAPELATLAPILEAKPLAVSPKKSSVLLAVNSPTATVQASVVKKSTRKKAVAPVELEKPSILEVIPELPDQEAGKLLARETSPDSVAQAEATRVVVVMSIAQPAMKPAAAVAEGEEISQEALVVDRAKKTSRAKRIFKQLRNLKNGEKVDWKEVGIRPDNLLSLVRNHRDAAVISK